jgi:excisionase family DNA binding protein
MGELKLNSESSLKTEYEEWMTSKEAAVFLRIGVQSLLNMVSNGQVRYYKLGRRNRYRRSDLQQLLIANARGGV